MPNPAAEAKRLGKELARKRDRERRARIRVDVRRGDEPMPAWPDKRPSDVWMVIEVPA